MSVAPYRKKPVVIEAIQFTGDNREEVSEFLGYAARASWEEPVNVIVIETLEGAMEAGVGDYIIKGIAGEFYPCRSDIFAASYEPAYGCRADD